MALPRYRAGAAPPAHGHQFCGVVEQVGEEVTTVRVGDFVVGGFNPCDNTCAACRQGATANCLNAAKYDGCQAELIRVLLADGTLVATPSRPDADLIPSLLALSDVMCTGWHAAVSAGVGLAPASPSSATGRSSCARCSRRPGWAPPP